MMSYEKTPEEKFWKKVKKTKDCWLWTGTIVRYGNFKFKNKIYSAHRFSWSLYHKRKIPSGMLICHRCDNPICVNPKHLFIGSSKDNARDMVQKGRSKPRGYQGGESNPFAKANWEMVEKIRKEYSLGKTTHRKLACKYKIGRSTVGAILKNQSWINSQHPNPQILPNQTQNPN